MKEPDRPFSDPRPILERIVRSDEFLERKRTTPEYFRSIALTAMELVGVELQRSRHLSREGNAYSMIAALPDFLDAQRHLDRLMLAKKSGCPIRQEERLPHLRKALRFNHALRTTIDNNPDLSGSDIFNFITRTGMMIFKPNEYDKNYLEENAREAIVGMQHEIITEQALFSDEIFEDIEEPNEEDDLSGSDHIFTYRGHRFKIDVKASKFGEEEAWKMWTEGRSLPFWTGLDSARIGNRLRAKPDEVEQVKQRLVMLLDRFVEDDAHNVAM